MCDARRAPQSEVGGCAVAMPRTRDGGLVQAQAQAGVSVDVDVVAVMVAAGVGVVGDGCPVVCSSRRRRCSLFSLASSLRLSVCPRQQQQQQQ